MQPQLARSRTRCRTLRRWSRFWKADEQALADVQQQRSLHVMCRQSNHRTALSLSLSPAGVNMLNRFYHKDSWQGGMACLLVHKLNHVDLKGQRASWQSEGKGALDARANTGREKLASPHTGCRKTANTSHTQTPRQGLLWTTTCFYTITVTCNHATERELPLHRIVWLWEQFKSAPFEWWNIQVSVRTVSIYSALGGGEEKKNFNVRNN